jgi:hypothetical protein
MSYNPSLSVQKRFVGKVKLITENLPKKLRSRAMAFFAAMPIVAIRGCRWCWKASAPVRSPIVSCYRQWRT